MESIPVEVLILDGLEERCFYKVVIGMRLRISGSSKNRETGAHDLPKTGKYPPLNLHESYKILANIVKR